MSHILDLMISSCQNLLVGKFHCAHTCVHNGRPQHGSGFLKSALGDSSGKKNPKGLQFWTLENKIFKKNAKSRTCGNSGHVPMRPQLRLRCSYPFPKSFHGFLVHLCDWRGHEPAKVTGWQRVHPCQRLLCLWVPEEFLMLH